MLAGIDTLQVSSVSLIVIDDEVLTGQLADNWRHVLEASSQCRHRGTGSSELSRRAYWSKAFLSIVLYHLRLGMVKCRPGSPAPIGPGGFFLPWSEILEAARSDTARTRPNKVGHSQIARTDRSWCGALASSTHHDSQPQILSRAPLTDRLVKAVVVESAGRSVSLAGLPARTGIASHHL